MSDEGTNKFLHWNLKFQSSGLALSWWVMQPKTALLLAMASFFTEMKMFVVFLVLIYPCDVFQYHLNFWYCLFYIFKLSPSEIFALDLGFGPNYTRRLVGSSLWCSIFFVRHILISMLIFTAGNYPFHVRIKCCNFF